MKSGLNLTSSSIVPFCRLRSSRKSRGKIERECRERKSREKVERELRERKSREKVERESREADTVTFNVPFCPSRKFVGNFNGELCTIVG